MKDICLLLTISQRDDAQRFIHFFQEQGVAEVYSALCNGTARQKTLDLLGLEQTEKTIHFAVASRQKVQELLRGLRRYLHLDLPDRGIALSVPVQSMGGAAALQYFLEGQKLTEKEESEMAPSYELIVVIAQRGYTDMVMDAAREAGASGGTTIHTKGTGGKNAEKFFGVSIAAEKEIVLIVAAAQSKTAIMKAVMQGAGMHTKAHALAFSLPVSETAGFQWEQDQPG